MNKDVIGVQEVSPGYEFVAENPAVPVGYKQTDVGVIPEDWDAVSLDSISRVTSGKRLPAGYFVTSHVTPHPYIRVSDMYQGGVEPKSIKYVPTGAFPAISQYRIFRDDLFISVAGTLGLVGKIPESLDGANLTENANRISDIQCHQDYLLYVLLSDLVQNTIESIRTVGAQPKLALARIRKFQIPLPPTLEEQRAIATALSDVDALLEELDRLIAKKRDIKQAAMQQLLTGETRLPGFEGDWVTRTIAELGRVGRGRVISHREISKSLDPKYPVYSSQTSNEGVMGYLDSYDFEGEFVTWTTDGANAGTVFARSGRFNCTNVCGTIEPYSGDYRFIAVALGRVSKSHVSRHLGNPKLMNDIVKKIAISIPPTYDEQSAISEVLSDMDTEIQALEQRRSKTAELKQGMMQELLTGRTRLV